MRVGVLSDTHVPSRARELPGELLSGLAGVDLILHAGDLVSREVLNVLQRIAPVEAVAGNGDPPSLLQELGRQKLLTLAGWRIALVHGHHGHGQTTVERALSGCEGADCVVFGHSHRAYQAIHRKVLAFNPGSATDRRWSPFYSYGILHMSPTELRGEIIYFGGRARGSDTVTALAP